MERTEVRERGGRPEVEWLREELAERGWSIRHLARRGQISHVHINRVLNGEADPGWKFYRGVARGLGLAPADVVRCTSGQAINRTVREIAERCRRLPEEQCAYVLAVVRLLDGGEDEDADAP